MLQCRPLVSHNTSYIKCPTPNIKERKLILDPRLDPDQHQNSISCTREPPLAYVYHVWLTSVNAL